MKNIDKKKLFITLGVGVAFVVACLFVFNIQKADTTQLVLTSICNSFFVVGGIFVCFGLLIWCSNHGAFIGLQYGFKMIFEKRRFEKSFQQRQSYGEFRASKLEKQKVFMHFIIVGVSFILISIIVLMFIQQ